MPHHRDSGTVYLLHFSGRVSDRHTCQHYLGWTPGPVAERVATHAAGRGARLTQVAAERGLCLTVARTWHGGRELERRLKNQKHGPRLCPLCNPIGKEARRAA
jgi:hypothetical protein